MLNRYLKLSLDDDPNLQSIYIKGEVSNFNHHRSGHMYFTLKDNDSRISAVMFKSDNQHVKFQIKNGMQVIVHGTVSIYEAFGEYQIYVREMEPDGIGSLYLAYEQLKKKLQEEGLFHQEHKQSLPAYPNHIGIITSPTGAAVRDMISTIKRRNKHIQITIIPTQVQGKEAVESIVKAIERANKLNWFDILLIGRGGGSIEDLWAFNEEAVVRAIFNSVIPVISAVGHETDTTISDFVSDVRAATPTGAAELAVKELTHMEELIVRHKQTMTQIMRHKLLHHQKQLQAYTQSKALQQPKHFIDNQRQTIDYLSMDLDRKIRRIVERKQDRFERFTVENYAKIIDRKRINEVKQFTYVKTRLQEQINKHIEIKRQRTQFIIEKVMLLNPLAILHRGYALPYDVNQSVIHSVKDIQVGDEMDLHMHDGTVHVSVESIEGSKDNE